MKWKGVAPDTSTVGKMWNYRISLWNYRHSVLTRVKNFTTIIKDSIGIRNHDVYSNTSVRWIVHMLSRAYEYQFLQLVECVQCAK